MSFLVGAIKGQLVLDTSKWNDALSRAKSDSKSFEGAILRHQAQIRRTGQILTGLGVAISGVSFGLAKMAGNAIESEQLFAAAMGDAEESVRRWSDELARNLRISSYALRETAGHFALIAQGAGIAEDAAMDMAQTLTELSYDMAAFYNRGPEEMFEKMRSGLLGMARPLKELGISLDETDVRIWGINNGLVRQGDELTNAQRTWLRYQLLLEQTAHTSGALADASDNLAKRMASIGFVTKDISTSIGMTLQGTFKALFSTLLDGLVVVRDWVDENRKLVGVIAMSVTAFGAMAVAAGPILIMLPGLATAAVAAGTTIKAMAVGLVAKFAVLAAAVAAVVYAFNNWHFIEAIVASVMGGVMNLIADAIDGLADFMRKMADIPVVGAAISRRAIDDMRISAMEMRTIVGFLDEELDEALSRQKRRDQDFHQAIQANAEQTKRAFQDMMSGWSEGDIQIELPDFDRWQQDFHKNVQETFGGDGFLIKTVQNAFNAMERTSETFFLNAFRGHITSARDLFREFANMMVEGLARILAQWLTMRAFGMAMGGGWGGAMNVLGSFAEGTPYVPYTGVYKLHAGEKVTPRYNAQEDGGHDREIVINNMIAPSAIAQSMLSREGRNVIVNVIDENSLRNGQVRKTIGRR